MDEDARQPGRGRRSPGSTAGSTPGGDAASAPSFGQRLWRGTREILIIVLITLLASFLVKTFLVRAYYIPSGSMEQTLQIGDRIFVNLLMPGPFELDRGDVIVFEDTKGWLGAPVEAPGNPVREAGEFIGLLPDSSQQHLVKRIIGMPGDRVACCDESGRITVNGVAVDEPYLYPGDAPSEIPFDETVPEDSLWVMGDHRSGSADSRLHQQGPGSGFVALDDVTGRAEVIAWPISRWGSAGGSRETFAEVPDTPAEAPQAPAEAAGRATADRTAELTAAP